MISPTSSDIRELLILSWIVVVYLVIDTVDIDVVAVAVVIAGLVKLPRLLPVLFCFDVVIVIACSCPIDINAQRCRYRLHWFL